MAARIEAQLARLGLELPQAPAAVGSYVPFVITGSLVHVSGQLPVRDGTMRHVGKLGESLAIEDGYAAARACALNLLAQVRLACGGDLDRVRRVVRLGGFVNASPAFNDAPKCVNGASDLMVELFGTEVGSHARIAVGVASLPGGAAVEVDGLFEIA